jgi:cellulose synthase/poly-beta-1,6-N-acetylglucosamine synthase-like glycosyltransferase
MILALSIAGIMIALIPAAMFLSNLRLFMLVQSDGEIDGHSKTSLSVLIPARDEQDAIENSIQAARASTHVDVEVVVLDDDSTDETAEIIQRIARSDAQVRYERSVPLPAGWNGKQHACKQLAEVASHQRIVFLDADVRLRPNALKRLSDYLDQSGVALVSAFPHQETGTLLEKWIIPMMHYVLLGFLPFARMRSNTKAAYAAGCGQLFMTTADAYRQAGTHEAIRRSRHDGLKLPRAYRNAGLKTDVVDGTSLAECRMYRSNAEVIGGVLKNAVEGIANPRLIVPFSVLLIGGSVLPVVTLVWSIIQSQPLAMMLSLVGVVIAHLPRAIAAVCFRQSVLGVLCHSLATLLFVSLQWIALAIHLFGRRVAWRGRTET